jgi:hypothetical protein
MEVSAGHARARAGFGGTISAVNRCFLNAHDWSPEVADVVSGVSVLCPAAVAQIATAR